MEGYKDLLTRTCLLPNSLRRSYRSLRLHDKNFSPQRTPPNVPKLGWRVENLHNSEAPVCDNIYSVLFAYPGKCISYCSGRLSSEPRKKFIQWCLPERMVESCKACRGTFVPPVVALLSSVIYTRGSDSLT